MSRASVRSFEAIQRVREEVQKFAHRSTEGLDHLEAEIRRVIDWVEHDRPGFWKEKARRAFDAEAEAKNELHRCLMYPINDEQPSCAEQRDALKKAQSYRLYCEDKQRKVREWAHTLRHELQEYQGRTSKLRRAVEYDTQASKALLAGALDALERYAGSSMTAGSRDAGADGAGAGGDGPSQATPQDGTPPDAPPAAGKEPSP